MKSIAFAAAIVAILFADMPVRAQDFPSKPIKIIVAVSPGGITDIAARTAADFLAKKTDQSVVVENRTGAAGNIGAEAVAKAAPDGTTLGLFATSQIVINANVMRHMPLDPLKDLVPVAPIAEAPQLLVINGKIPVRTLAEFIAYARRESGKLNYVTIGAGSTVSLAGSQFVRLAGLDMQPVQYRGTAAAISDLVAGNVHLISVGLAPVKSLVESGALRVLASGTAKRLSYLPDVPTAAEAGLPGYEMTTWFALFAPAGTPKPVVERLNAAMRELTADPAAMKRFTDLNIDPMSMGAGEFAAFVKKEAVKWERIIKAAGVKAE
jgi:tripartite-type tricarboxylate transporter receptor subunit TctC